MELHQEAPHNRQIRHKALYAAPCPSHHVRSRSGKPKQMLIHESVRENGVCLRIHGVLLGNTRKIHKNWCNSEIFWGGVSSPCFSSKNTPEMQSNTLFCKAASESLGFAQPTSFSSPYLKNEEDDNREETFAHQHQGSMGRGNHRYGQFARVFLGEQRISVCNDLDLVSL